MIAHVLLNLLNEFGNRDQMRGLPSILSLFTKSLINSRPECYLLRLIRDFAVRKHRICKSKVLVQNLARVPNQINARSPLKGFQ